MISSKEAKELLRLGRQAVEASFRSSEPEIPEEVKERFAPKRGVFTTLLTYPEERLRGCMGVVEPKYPLWQGVVYTSLKAAFSDPRFPPLREEELGSVIWELSILSALKPVPKELLPGSINIGIQGLMVEKGVLKGLLLPQVATEHSLSPEEFLALTCRKAGLPDGCWKDKDTQVYTFEAQVFRETKPPTDK